MNNNDEGYDENTGEIKIEGDRGAPEVAKTGAGRIIMMVAFGFVCLLAFMAVIYDGMSKNNSAPKTKKEEIVFNAPKPRANPYIVQDPTAPLQDNFATIQEPQIDPLLLRQQMAIQEQALRAAQERQKQLEARLKSPQVVYDQSAQTPAQANFTTTQSENYNGGASLLSGGNNNNDPNMAFAKGNANTQVATATATKLQNLDTLIAQGKMISGILETAIQSDLPGMVRAITSENVYSFDGSTLLIPKGSRLVGQYQSGVRQGQSRVFVI